MRLKAFGHFKAYNTMHGVWYSTFVSDDASMFGISTAVNPLELYIREAFE